MEGLESFDWDKFPVEQTHGTVCCSSLISCLPWVANELLLWAASYDSSGPTHGTCSQLMDRINSSFSRTWDVLSVCAHSVISHSLWPQGLQPARLLCPWNFSGKNTGVGCHFLLQGIFLIQRWNLCVSWVSCTGRWVLYHYATWEDCLKYREETK